jgi:hypothetical protein
MNDYKLLLEKQLTQPGDFAACFAFSIHKAGSTLMHNMIAQVCAEANIPALNIPAILFREGIRDQDWRDDKRLLEFITPGRIYYGYRYLPEILQGPETALENSKSVLLVRDPRDALVSEYYSYGGKHLTHKLPDKNSEQFIKSKEATKALDIDPYVLNNSGNYLKKLQDYKNFLNFDNVLLRRYEQIFFDKHRFLADIFNHFDISVPADILARVAEKNDVRPQSEDQTKHIRKGTPGDYREKLKPETIVKLNDRFQEIGRWYGYDLND